MAPAAQDEVDYCNCMESARHRLALVRSIVQKEFTTGTEGFDVELVFLQFRKVLELIAFGSLISHKSEYAALHPRFNEHWKAKAMLEEVRKINPEFYPVPINPPTLQPDGTKLVTFIEDGFLTRAEFEELYDYSSEVIHTRNPFSGKGANLHIRYSAQVWLQRIQTLLSLHIIRLLDERKWIGEVPMDLSKRVHLFPASPAPNSK